MTALNTGARIRVLVCDDSLLFRSILQDLFENDPEVEVIGEAVNGKEAIEQVLLLKPDIVTMDLEMPIMGGHEAIQQIMAIYAVPILVVSSLDDAKNAYKAISNGALDVIGKPQLETLEIEAFIKKIKMLSQIKVIKHINRSITSKSIQIENLKKTALDQSIQTKSEEKSIFAIASSTGGPHALEAILKVLPADFPSPIVISQHISKGFSHGLAEWLNNSVPLKVKIAEESEKLLPGHVYISPSQYNLSIDNKHCVDLSAIAHNSIYHPSCDILLESIALNYGQKGVGIICTGMGSDGASGMERVYACGGVTIAQDEASSVIFGMNKVAISRNCINYILPLENISGKMLLLSGYHLS